MSCQWYHSVEALSQLGAVDSAHSASVPGMRDGVDPCNLHAPLVQGVGQMEREREMNQRSGLPRGSNNTAEEEEEDDDEARG